MVLWHALLGCVVACGRGLFSLMKWMKSLGKTIYSLLSWFVRRMSASAYDDDLPGYNPPGQSTHATRVQRHIKDAIRAYEQDK